MQMRKTESRRKNKQDQQDQAAQSASQVNEEASSNYAGAAEEMRQNLDAAIANLATDTVGPAGPSLPLGQQSAHGVVRPDIQRSSGSSERQILSSEAFVQNFRQTSGE